MSKIRADFLGRDRTWSRERSQSKKKSLKSPSSWVEPKARRRISPTCHRFCVQLAKSKNRNTCFQNCFFHSINCFWGEWNASRKGALHPAEIDFTELAWIAEPFPFCRIVITGITRAIFICDTRKGWNHFAWNGRKLICKYPGRFNKVGIRIGDIVSIGCHQRLHQAE